MSGRELASARGLSKPPTPHLRPLPASTAAHPRICTRPAAPGVNSVKWSPALTGCKARSAVRDSYQVLRINAHGPTRIHNSELASGSQKHNPRSPAFPPFENNPREQSFENDQSRSSGGPAAYGFGCRTADPGNVGTVPPKRNSQIHAIYPTCSPSCMPVSRALCPGPCPSLMENNPALKHVNLSAAIVNDLLKNGVPYDGRPRQGQQPSSVLSGTNETRQTEQKTCRECR